MGGSQVLGEGLGTGHYLLGEVGGGGGGYRMVGGGGGKFYKAGGRGTPQNRKIQGPKLLALPPQDRVKPFPLLKDGNFF